MKRRRDGVKQRYWVRKISKRNYRSTTPGKTIDKIKGFEFDKEGKIKPKEKDKSPVIFSGMLDKEKGEQEDGWFDERGNFHINPKDEEK